MKTDPFAYMSGLRTNVEDFLLACDQVPSIENIKLYKKLVDEEILELTVALEKNDAVEVLDAICDSIWVLLGLAIAAKLPVAFGWREVYETNMAKIGPLGKVVRNDFGKIMKPAGWLPPNLKRVLEIYGRDNLVNPIEGHPSEAQLKLDLIERAILASPLTVKLNHADISILLQAIGQYV